MTPGENHNEWYQYCCSISMPLKENTTSPTHGQVGWTQVQRPISLKKDQSNRQAPLSREIEDLTPNAHILLNSLNELGKSDKMRGLPSILSLFRNKFNNFNNTRARLLDSIYHMALRLLLKSHFCLKYV